MGNNNVKQRYIFYFCIGTLMFICTVYSLLSYFYYVLIDTTRMEREEVTNMLNIIKNKYSISIFSKVLNNNTIDISFGSEVDNG